MLPFFKFCHILRQNLEWQEIRVLLHKCYENIKAKSRAQPALPSRRCPSIPPETGDNAVPFCPVGSRYFSRISTLRTGQEDGQIPEETKTLSPTLKHCPLHSSSPLSAFWSLKVTIHLRRLVRCLSVYLLFSPSDRFVVACFYCCAFRRQNVFKIQMR